MTATLTDIVPSLCLRLNEEPAGEGKVPLTSRVNAPVVLDSVSFLYSAAAGRRNTRAGVGLRAYRVREGRSPSGGNEEPREDGRGGGD